MNFEEMTKLPKQLKAKGLDVDVYVTYYGMFYAKIDETNWVQTKIYSELEQLLVGAINKQSKNLTLPFCKISRRDGIKKYIIRGIHGSNGDWLVTYEDGTNDRISKLDDIYDIPSEELQIEHRTLAAAFEKAISDFKELETKMIKVPGKEVEKRVKKALAGESS